MTDTLVEEPLRIISLEAENVKRLKAIRIKPDKTLVRIEGKNAAGKSSVLDAIAAALGGAKWQPDKPVREGTKKAKVVVDLGDIVVERKWTTKGGNTIVVTSKEGQPQKGPQALLNRLMGDLTFDPLEFVRMAPGGQNEVLRKLAGLDFTELEKKREEVYTERTLINRQARAAGASLGGAVAKPDKPAIEISELVTRQKEAVQANRDYETIRKAIDEKQKAINESIAYVDDFAARLNAAQVKLAERNADFDQLEAQLEGLPGVVDITELATEIGEATQHNEAIAAYEQYQEQGKDVTALEEAADTLSKQIEDMDEEKETRLRDAKFPVDGISLGDDGPTLNGIPFSQASSAEQLRTGVAIGLAGKPRCRVMLIRDGSLLDGDNLKALYRIAEEYDAQVFVERVAESASPSAVFIEDGEIVETSDAEPVCQDDESTGQSQPPGA